MLLRIKELAAKGSIPIKGEVDLTGLLKARQDVVSFGNAEADLQANMSEGLAEVTGNVHVELHMACSRCLKPVEELIDAPFQEWFAGQASSVPKELEEDVHLVTDDTIDLTPLVEETAALSIPLVTLCSEDCKGLCPDCGADRNEQACSCKKDKIDPRLAGLADFFKEK
ncbi:YceD family protein [Paenibacillus sp. MBLB4367]|uniref:YceD family protein n=1 Tax=Paenibacillus sp. MBLB4367 TaxID=3384767 RepID=UPI0039082A4F